MTTTKKSSEFKCIFCGAESSANSNTRMVISGLKNYSICFDCIKKCNEIYQMNANSSDVASANNYLDEVKTYKPIEIKEKLDQFVVGQDKAKVVLAVAIYNHFLKLRNNINSDVNNQLDKSNILMIGDSGSGKCVTKDTKVRIRNKKTGEIKDITIDEFKNSICSC